MFTQTFIADAKIFVRLAVGVAWLAIASAVFVRIACHEAMRAAHDCTLSVVSVLWLILCIIAAGAAFLSLCAASRAYSKAYNDWNQHRRERNKKN